MNKKWTQEELVLLTELYPIHGPQYCADRLGRTRASVTYKAHEKKLKSPAIKPQLWNNDLYDNRLLELEADFVRVEDYINARTPILHMCYEGHSWRARPDNVRMGTGCPTCAKYGFKLDKPALVYYVKLSNRLLTLYKIGVTNETTSIARLFRESDKKITVIKEWTFEKGHEAKKFEQAILLEHRGEIVEDFLNGTGKTELFTSDVLNLDKD